MTSRAGPGASATSPRVGSTTWPAWLKGRGASRADVDRRRVGAASSTPSVPRRCSAERFGPDDDVPNAPPVARPQLRHVDVAVRRRSLDLGTRINLDDRLSTIVGVMPTRFRRAARRAALDAGRARFSPLLHRRRSTTLGSCTWSPVCVPASRATPPGTELERFVEARLAQAHVSRPGPHLALISVRRLLGGTGAAGALVSARRRGGSASHQLCERVGADARADVHAAAGAWYPARARGDGGAISLARGSSKPCCSPGPAARWASSSAHWIVRALVALAPSDVPRLAEVVDRSAGCGLHRAHGDRDRAAVRRRSGPAGGLDEPRRGVNETGRATGSLHTAAALDARGRANRTLGRAAGGVRADRCGASSICVTSTSGSRRRAC